MGHNFQKRSSKLPEAPAVVEKKYGSTRYREAQKSSMKTSSVVVGSHGKPSSSKTKVTNKDELVRYMSNLPSYLQRENVEDKKALNFGVLDWDRLENWKQNRNHSQPKHNQRDTSSAHCKITIHDSGTDTMNAMDLIKNSKRMLMATARRNMDKKVSKDLPGNKESGAHKSIVLLLPKHSSTEPTSKQQPTSDSRKLKKASKEDFRYETARSCPLSEHKVSHSSPNRLFSKMSKSMSYKESESNDGSVKSKTGGHTRAKSSPLRRLLDPLLKHSSQWSKNVQPLEGNKLVPERVKALLHVTSLDGSPLFKLTVDNSSRDVIVAMKRMQNSIKCDYSCVYSFYSVHEIMKKKKKTSGIWSNHGNKERNSGFGYNTIGHMKISSSESVLYSVESPELTSNREVAAVVNKNTVVVSSGTHSLPEKGVLLPLVDRWKMGGKCDCGGWDVGCQLRILGNKDEGGSKEDGLHLFLEGDACETKPIFSLLAMNKGGVYSVEFRDWISLVQALFIAIAVIDEDGAKLEPKSGKMSSAKYVSSPPPSPVGRV